MKNKKGFTLFELLVSISIIAILVAVASTSFSAAQKKARDSRRMEDMETVRKAAEQYYMLNNGNYPYSGGTPSAPWTAGTAWSVNGQNVLPSFPKDPKGASYTQYNATTTTASAYCLCALLENKVGNSSSNACAWVSGIGDYYCVSNQQ